MNGFWRVLANGTLSFISFCLLSLNMLLAPYILHRGLVSLIVPLITVSSLLIGIWASTWTLVSVFERTVPWYRFAFILPFVSIVLWIFR